MKVIIIGSSRGFTRLSADESYPLYLTKTPYKDFSFLDWTLNELKKIKINDVIFIGGYHIEKIIKSYPGLKIIYNENWEKDNSINLLSLIKENLTKDTLILNSNVLFRSKLIKKSLSKNISFIISNNNKFNLENSILFLKKKNLLTLTKLLETKKITNISSLKNIFKNQNELYQIIDDENFSLFENDDSIARFILGTKAQTLLRLKSLINKANILNQLTINNDNWKKDKDKITKKIKTIFKGKKIVIRSSALAEDSWLKSNAGSFKSFLNVNSKNYKLVESKINNVFNSYTKYDSFDFKNEVLIQKYLSKTKLSGVLFSISNQNGSPYYIINYDDTSGNTDTVTSGTTSDTKTLFIYKNYQKKLSEIWIMKLLNVVKEIERKILYFKLDIEFAIDNKNNIFILQVRPLILNKKIKLFSNTDFDIEIMSLQQYLKDKINFKENIFGNTTLFSNMTDWNPAEMIGIQPKPLDYSLYCYLITNKSWAVARKKMGYNDISDKKLLVLLSGKPYIDIRRSFNSFLIPKLTKKLSYELINKEIQYLKSNPAQHDKVEFNVVINCYNLYFTKTNEHLTRNLKISKFNSKKIIETYSKWTNNLILNSKELFKELDSHYLNLNKKIDEIKYSNNDSILVLSSKLNQILNICVESGVTPFSIHARCGFIALQILESLLDQKIISKNDYDNFLKNIPTISSKFSLDLNDFLNKKITKKIFIKRFGHLRPSTYDISSKNYENLISESFFNKHSSNINASKSKLTIAKKIWQKNNIKILKKLKSENFDVNQLELFNFLTKSIQGREKGKYEFTKCINKSFEIINIISKKINIPVSELQFLPIEVFLNFENNNFINISNIKKNINFSKKKHYLTSLVKLPSVISEDKDIFEIKQFSTVPNFITSKKVKGEVLFLKDYKSFKDVSNKIVLIESADPGYDWLFSYNIIGLITKFGGAASHMAIRSAEYGIPSIIGCGEDIFNEISTYNKIFIDCYQKIFRKLI